MKKILFIVFVTLGLFACNEVSKEDIGTDHSTVETTKNESTDVKVNANTMMTMEVEGMVCKMGCGGSIRKGLKATNAIDKVDFDFDEERTVNFAKIYFDNTITSEEEIIQIVTTLNNNQFTVGNTETTNVITIEEENKTSSSDSKKDVIIDACSQANGIELPNLLDFLSRLFT